MFFVRDLTYRIGARTLFDRASLSISSKQHIGLIGVNGSGKSTLFKLMMGELSVDGGLVERANQCRIGIVRQDLPDSDMSLLDIVLLADEERHQLMQRVEKEQDPDELVACYERLEMIDAYRAPARASLILMGLGFDEEAQQQPISALSGGWRMRVALASALFAAPDLLLLDEPTNHLDIEALTWLEDYLAHYEKAFLMISHDRDMLNKTVDHIIHLSDTKLAYYRGNYDQFEQACAQKDAQLVALYEKQMRQKDHMMVFVNRFGAKASKAKQAQSRLKAIEKMDIVDIAIRHRVQPFHFPNPTNLPPPLMVLDEVNVGYIPGKPILKRLNCRIDQGDRIALLGANGNGKSTFIKLLVGELQPEAGEVIRSGAIKIGYFAQYQTELLDITQTPYQILKSEQPDLAEAKIRAALGNFGFDKQKADTRVAELSGGEKSRLLFAMMSRHVPHMMVLDEPTNHLDMEARQALMDALNAYEGCVVLVSHDPYLVTHVADQLWWIHDGRCEPYDGDLDSYQKMVIEERKRSAKQQKQSSINKLNNNISNQDPARQLTKKIQKDLAQLEKKIAKLLEQERQLEMRLAEYGTMVDHNEMLRITTIQFHQTQEARQTYEREWLELQLRLDN
jgi:ATP-binding cassette subfamily F protein 3